MSKVSVMRGGESDSTSEPLEREAHRASEQALTARPRLDTPRNVLSPIEHAGLGSSGRPLPHRTRAFYEPRFGFDLSQIRVHVNPALADANGATAFTRGNHIVFGEGAYRPDHREGMRVLGHEIAHVIQQRGRRHVVGTPPVPIVRQSPVRISRIRKKPFDQAPLEPVQTDAANPADEAYSFYDYYDELDASLLKNVLGNGNFLVGLPGSPKLRDLPPKMLKHQWERYKKYGTGESFAKFVNDHHASSDEVLKARRAEMGEGPSRKQPDTDSPTPSKKTSGPPEGVTQIGKRKRQLLKVYWQDELARAKRELARAATDADRTRWRNARSRAHAGIHIIDKKMMPSPTQSEMETAFLRHADRLLPAMQDAPPGALADAVDAVREPAFKDGRPADRSERGSSRPDVRDGNDFIEVKDYRLDGSRASSSTKKGTLDTTALRALTANLADQISKRRNESLPYDHRNRQSVMLDLRGQRLSPADIQRVRAEVAAATGLPATNVEVLTWGGKQFARRINRDPPPRARRQEQPPRTTESPKPTKSTTASKSTTPRPTPTPATPKPPRPRPSQEAPARPPKAKARTTSPTPKTQESPKTQRNSGAPTTPGPANPATAATKKTSPTSAVPKVVGAPSSARTPPRAKPRKTSTHADLSGLEQGRLNLTHTFSPVPPLTTTVPLLGAAAAGNGAGVFLQVTGQIGLQLSGMIDAPPGAERWVTTVSAGVLASAGLSAKAGLLIDAGPLNAEATVSADADISFNPRVQAKVAITGDQVELIGLESGLQADLSTSFGANLTLQAGIGSFSAGKVWPLVGPYTLPILHVSYPVEGKPTFTISSQVSALQARAEAALGGIKNTIADSVDAAADALTGLDEILEEEEASRSAADQGFNTARDNWKTIRKKLRIPKLKRFMTPQEVQELERIRRAYLGAFEWGKANEALGTEVDWWSRAMDARKQAVTLMNRVVKRLEEKRLAQAAKTSALATAKSRLQRSIGNMARTHVTLRTLAHKKHTQGVTRTQIHPLFDPSNNAYLPLYRQATKTVQSAQTAAECDAMNSQVNALIQQMKQGIAGLRTL